LTALCDIAAAMKIVTPATRMLTVERVESIPERTQRMRTFLILRWLFVSFVSAASAASLVSASAAEKPKANTLVLTRKGPFQYDQELLEEAIEKPWIELLHAGFSSPTFDYFRLQYTFGDKQDPDRRMRVTVTATSSGGTTHTLIDKVCVDQSGVRVGMGSVECEMPRAKTECLGLPVKPSAIERMTLSFTEISKDEAATLSKQGVRQEAPMRAASSTGGSSQGSLRESR
jgi:hypothetical protein